MATNKRQTNIKNLVRIKTFADNNGVSPQWIFKLRTMGKITFVDIDRCKFIDTSLYPVLPR